MAAVATNNKPAHRSNNAGSNCYMISVVGKNDTGTLSTSKDSHTCTINAITSTSDATNATISNNVDTTTDDAGGNIVKLDKQFEYQSSELKSQLLHT